jgi:hypothetical protein
MPPGLAVHRADEPSPPPPPPPSTPPPRASEKIEPETDPRFPSGAWTGFWVQRCYVGRQYMTLNLAFADGVVRGDGFDRVGEFTLAGTYDLRTGSCSMTKAYVGAHAILYEGRNEGDGQWIWGVWRMRTDRGGFHIWPAGEDDPTGRTLKEERELPAPPQKRKLKPPPLVEEPAGTP